MLHLLVRNINNKIKYLQNFLQERCCIIISLETPRKYFTPYMRTKLMSDTTGKYFIYIFRIDFAIFRINFYVNEKMKMEERGQFVYISH